MAIPLSSNQEHIEEQYQRLERILYELYLVLRALMEPQAQPLPPTTAHLPPRGGSGGGSRRRSRRRHSSSRRRPCCPNGGASSASNGPQDPPPSPPSSNSCTDSQASSTALLLNLANAAVTRKASTPGSSCAVVDSVQWGKVGCDLRIIADSLNLAKCQQNDPLLSFPLKSSSQSPSTLKLVTLALSLLTSRKWSSD